LAFSLVVPKAGDDAVPVSGDHSMSSGRLNSASFRFGDFEVFPSDLAVRVMLIFWGFSSSPFRLSCSLETAQLPGFSKTSHPKNSASSF
jgi:hypothetical protein